MYDTSSAPSSPQPAPAGTPWHSFAVAFGATSIIVGVIWDISWHSTIGRDTFWTPAHMAIYLGGVLGGLIGGWLVLESTFGRARTEESAAAVRVWGFRGPLGAWVLVWGALAMVVSAGFDDWWHNAYGLDVEIVSPPHSVLALGIMMVGAGAMLLLLSRQNRTPGGEAAPAGLLCSYSFGVLVTMAAIFVTEYSYPNLQRTGTFYQVSCMTYPFYLVAAARISRLRWPATSAAAAYMLINLVMGWILPLFPARPLLGPIYNPLDHMAAPPFPLALVVPAVGIDILERRFRRETGARRGWAHTVLAGAIFLGLFLPTQWFFSEFLISPAADNWLFFGNRFYAYFSQPGEHWWRYWGMGADAMTPGGVLISLACSIAAARIGLWAGGWMARVRR